MFDPETCAKQAEVLRDAADASPLATIVGFLRKRAAEYNRACVQFMAAVEDGEEPVILPAAVMAPGVNMYDGGRAEVLRVLWQQGVPSFQVKAMGEPSPYYINVSDASTPVVVIP